MTEPTWRAFDVKTEDNVATVSILDRAMGPEFFEELPVLFRGLDADPDVRAIVLRGSGGHFSFGLDLVKMAPLLGAVMGRTGVPERQAFLAGLRSLQDSITAVAECRTPIVAALTGWCIGGGLDLAAAVDIRVASADAQFSLREVKMAMVADIGSLQRLVGIIGDGHLRQLALTGEDIDAERAQRIGLVNDVHETPEAALAAATQLAAAIAANSPLVTSGIKEVLGAERAASVAAGLRYVGAWNAAFIGSEDLAEAVTAFSERRPASFTGR